MGWLTLLIVFESVALSAVKVYTQRRHWPWLLAACLIYGLAVPPLLAQATALEGIGLANFGWNVLSTIAMLAVGTLVFHEGLTWQMTAGIAISMLGLGTIVLSAKNT